MKDAHDRLRGILFSLLGEDGTRLLIDSVKYAACSISLPYRESMRRLASYRDIHKGERCFIIGNGPSINGMDLARLKGEYTFGLNRIYMNFDKMGFITTYLVAVNRYVISQFGHDISEVKCPKFVDWVSRAYVPLKDDVVYLRTRRGPMFSSDVPRRGVWGGATVTYVAMQLAYYMGFSRVILVGIDHEFVARGSPHELVESEGPDENHFSKDYFGPGCKWHLPDLQTSEVAYALARDQFESDGREIVDATVGGSLDIFEKVDYPQLF